MRHLFILLLLLLQQCVFAQGSEQMIFQNDLRIASGEIGNLTGQMLEKSNWYKDENGDEAALLRVKVIDMPLTEIKKLAFQGSACVKRDVDEKEHTCYVSVGAGRNGTYIEAFHEVFQQSNRLRLENLKAGKLYDVTLVNNKTTSIVVTTEPKGINVYIDEQAKGQTPITIENMRYGAHTLKLSQDGRMLKTEKIEVEEGHTHFEYDLRDRKEVEITSDPNGATIYIDGEFIGKAPIKHALVLGAHTFRAVLNAEQFDEQSINVTEGTTIIDMHPVKKSNVMITTKYSGRPASATLVVDNEKNFNGEETYRLVLPYGKHTFRLNYSGATKEKTLNINRPEYGHVFRLSAKNDFVWPWQREYNDRPAGFSIGYVSKQLVSKYESERVKLDPAYYREGKWLPGIQIGLHFQPTFSWGGGLYTGLFYELYFTKSDNFGGDPVDEAYQHFTEHSLNLPLHLYYRMPFSKNFSIALHGGVGMDIGIYAFYAGSFMGAGDDSNSEVMSDYYGEENYGPKRVNFTLDFGASFNIGPVAINGFFSKGLTNHTGIIDWDGEKGTTHINKFGFSISYLIGGEK